MEAIGYKRNDRSEDIRYYRTDANCFKANVLESRQAAFVSEQIISQHNAADRWNENTQQ